MRWSNEHEYQERCLRRNEILTELLKRNQKEGARLVEFGCGPSRPASRLLQDFCVSVTPADLKEWAEDVVVCDLEAESPNFPPGQVFVASGVLEYIGRLEQCLEGLATHYEAGCISYACYSEPVGYPTRRRTKKIRASVRQRVSSGFRTHLSETEFLNKLAPSMVVGDVEFWEDQICVYVRSRYLSPLISPRNG